MKQKKTERTNIAWNLYVYNVISRLYSVSWHQLK